MSRIGDHARELYADALTWAPADVELIYEPDQCSTCGADLSHSRNYDEHRWSGCPMLDP